MISSILGVLSGLVGVLSGLVSFGLKVWGWFTTRSEQKVGADAQSGRDNAAAESTESRIAQAEIDAPKTKADAMKRLMDGSA